MPYPLRTRARIALHVVWDHLTRPSVADPAEVPWCAESVTTGWLTPILCSDVPGAAVIKVDTVEASAGSSVRRRLQVNYNQAGEDAGLESRFFAKTTPSLLTRLSSAMSASEEAQFFQCIPLEIPIETPIHRYSAFDKRSGRSFHLFEDLVATRGARFCNHRSELDQRQWEQIVDLLAILHGSYYDSARFSSDLSWLPTYEAYFRTCEREGFHEGHDRAMVVARHVIPQDVFERRDQIWPLAVAGLAAHSTEPPTVLHSDVHVGNWYVTEDGKMGLCDWQCICRGHWARDISYALCTIMSIEDRRAHEHALLLRYLDKLEDSGGPSVELNKAWQMYRQQMFAALLMWTPTLCHPPTMPDMQPEETSLKMIERISTAISDLDSFASYGGR
jgi:hypothetical protein